MRRLTEFFAEKNALYVLYGLAVIAHLAVFYALLYLYGPCSFFLSSDCSVNGNDTQHYVTIAYNLTHGHGYSRFPDAPYEADALRTPLLPLYFAPFTYFGGYSLIWLAILLLNLVLALAAPLAYKLARYYLSHSYALLVGVGMALEPLYLYRSQIAEPDALLVLLMLVSLFFVVRSWYRGYTHDLYRAAVFLGLAILAKPSALYLSLLILTFVLMHLLVFEKNTYKEKIKVFALCFGIVMVVAAPWIMRNTYVFGTTAVSSIQGYNLYEYYTNDIPLPNEQIPEYITNGSREPSRYLPYQRYFTELSIERIKAHPVEYTRTHIVGSLRNLFVSDISQIIYYHHERLLPVAYNPESKINLHELLLSGDFSGMLREFFSSHVFPKVTWFGFMGLLYIFAAIGWVFAFTRNRVAFLSYTLFALLYGYLIVSCGPFVDAKYRLPGLVLVFIAAMYGLEQLARLLFLRSKQK